MNYTLYHVADELYIVSVEGHTAITQTKKYTETNHMLPAVERTQQAYEIELEKLGGRTHWDSKNKQCVPDTSKHGHLPKSFHSFYSNLKDAKKKENRLFKAAANC